MKVSPRQRRILLWLETVVLFFAVLGSAYAAFLLPITVPALVFAIAAARGAPWIASRPSLLVFTHAVAVAWVAAWILVPLLSRAG
jgi:hypothetical protein